MLDGVGAAEASLGVVTLDTSMRVEVQPTEESRPQMARERCERCRRFKFKGDACKCRSVAKEFVLDVDGTLGSGKERHVGGVAYVGGMGVERRNKDGDRVGATGGKERVHLGEPYTAIPKAWTRWED